MFSSRRLQLFQHGSGHRHSCCGHQVWTGESIIKNVAWRADQISDGSMLFRSIGSCEYFPQASHTVLIERRTRLAAGTSPMKYTRIKNEQEIKTQEIKNLITFCISENGQRNCQGEPISFFFWCHMSSFTFQNLLRSKNRSRCDTIKVRIRDCAAICADRNEKVDKRNKKCGPGRGHGWAW